MVFPCSDLTDLPVAAASVIYSESINLTSSLQFVISLRDMNTRRSPMLILIPPDAANLPTKKLSHLHKLLPVRNQGAKKRAAKSVLLRANGFFLKLVRSRIKVMCGRMNDASKINRKKKKNVHKICRKSLGD